jgi:hypothetical protein
MRDGQYLTSFSIMVTWLERSLLTSVFKFRQEHNLPVYSSPWIILIFEIILTGPNAVSHKLNEILAMDEISQIFSKSQVL